MNMTTDKAATLEMIRDHYRDIQLIAMHCCSDISTEAIPGMINQRAEILTLIAEEERCLAAFDNHPSENDPNEEMIRDEIRSIITSIVSLDAQLEEILQNHLHRIKKELTVLSKTSRAVSAYTIQSRVYYQQP